MTRKPVSVRDHVRKLVDTLDDKKVSAMLEAVEPSGPRKPGPKPRAGSPGVPITFRASEAEKLAFIDAAGEDGFADLSKWILSLCTDRLAQLEEKRRR